MQGTQHRAQRGECRVQKAGSIEALSTKHKAQSPVHKVQSTDNTTECKAKAQSAECRVQSAECRAQTNYKEQSAGCRAPESWNCPPERDAQQQAQRARP